MKEKLFVGIIDHQFLYCDNRLLSMKNFQVPALSDIAFIKNGSSLCYMDAKIWFKKKTYGWGWTPCTWQGVVVVVVYVIVLAFTVSFTRSGALSLSSTQLAITLIAQSGLLIAVSYAKGEKPSWSWGKSKF